MTVSVTKDTAPPVVFPPADIASVEAAGATTAIDDLGTASAEDANDGAIGTVTPSTTGPFPLGTSEIVWSASDALGNTGTATQRITVVDTLAPVVTAPAAVTLEASALQTTLNAAQLGVASATDLVDGTVTATPAIGETYPVGSGLVTWSATDSAGNTGTATQQIALVDTLAPVLVVADDIRWEASADLNAVPLGITTATDAVEGGLIPLPSTTGPFPLGETVVVWRVTDSSGNSASANQIVTVEDTQPPSVSFAQNPVNIDAKSVLTPFSMQDIGMTMRDATSLTMAMRVDGKPLANDQSGQPEPFSLLSGSHTLVLSVTDRGGNTVDEPLTVNITPRVDFAVDQVVGNGRHFDLRANLSGPAVTYPVSVPFTIDNTSTTIAPIDHNAVDGTITITEGLTGSVRFTVNNTAADRSTIEFSMGTPSNARPTGTPTHKVTVVVENVPPRINPIITQGGTRVSQLTIGGGVVRVEANADDPNAGQTLSYDWSASSSALIFAVDTTQPSLTFDPAALSAGNYNVGVRVSDGVATTTVVRMLRIIAGDTAVADADGDGIADSNDNPGLPPEVLQSNIASGGNQMMVAESGIALRLGDLALQQGAAAALMFTQLPTEAQTNVGDFNTAAALFDYEAGNLPEVGASIRLVLPLDAPTPAGARLRKYDAVNGWRAFTLDANNRLFTAVSSDPQGVCPVVNDAQYQEIPSTGLLPVGHWCLQLQIQDGGTNDADGLANGIIVDPVTVQTAITSNLTVATSSAGTGVSVASRGDSNVAVLVFTLVADSGNLVIDALTLQADGSGDDAVEVASVKLYTDNNADGSVLGETLLGSGKYNNDNGSLHLTLNAPHAIGTTPSQYIITYDFAD